MCFTIWSLRGKCSSTEEKKLTKALSFKSKFCSTTSPTIQKYVQYTIIYFTFKISFIKQLCLCNRKDSWTLEIYIICDFHLVQSNHSTSQCDGRRSTCCQYRQNHRIEIPNWFLYLVHNTAEHKQKMFWLDNITQNGNANIKQLKIIDIDKYDLCNRYIFSASTAGETEI